MATTGLPGRTADRALLWSLKAWRGSVDERYWKRFQPAWRERLEPGWEFINRASDSTDSSLDAAAESIRSRLAAEHAGEARLDLSSVHPSWWIRALKGESAAVQRAVAAASPESIRSIIVKRLGLDPASIVPDRKADPRVVACVCTLWTERLLAGPAVNETDPPVIAAIAGLRPTDLVRVLTLAGLCKIAYLGKPPGAKPGETRRAARRRERMLDFRTQWTEKGSFQTAEIGELVKRDAGASKTAAGRRAIVHLGLTTIARLLAIAEPYRVRWALQRLPYDSAKPIRGLMKLDLPGVSRGDLIALEHRVLVTALRRLESERSRSGTRSRGASA